LIGLSTTRSFSRKQQLSFILRDSRRSTLSGQVLHPSDCLNWHLPQFSLTAECRHFVHARSDLLANFNSCYCSNYHNYVSVSFGPGRLFVSSFLSSPSMQVSKKHGIIYLITKYGFIHLYNLESIAMVPLRERRTTCTCSTQT